MDIDELLEFAKLGTYIQYDLFGIECSYYQLNSSVDMPSDAVRINNFIKLVEEGLEDKLLMAHDIHTKHRLVCLNSNFFSYFTFFFKFNRHRLEDMVITILI